MSPSPSHKPSLDLPKIAAALNAYPWTPGLLTSCGRVPTYCAIGAMLRYAGVAQDHIAAANGPAFWSLYGPLLQSEYGIPDIETAGHVMAANDSASSQAEAIDQVLGVLTGTIDFETIMRKQAGIKPAPAAEPSWKAEPEDDTGSLALVV